MSCIRQMTNILTQEFERVGSDAPRVCARALIGHVLGVDSLFLATNPQYAMSDATCAQLRVLAQRHAGGEPLAYILGEKEFYGRAFLVNRHTLIPRPESEDVLDALLGRLKRKDAVFIDVGTGSGCLAVTFAAQRVGACGIMLDRSAEALLLACENARRLGVSERLLAVRGDLCNLPVRAGSVDVIISNPPYISECEYGELAVTVRDFEPKSALVPSWVDVGGESDGLEHLAALARQAYGLLRDGGMCIVEHGSTQGGAVAAKFAEHGSWAVLEIGCDMGGLERFCLCVKK